MKKAGELAYIMVTLHFTLSVGFPYSLSVYTTPLKSTFYHSCLYLCFSLVSSSVYFLGPGQHSFFLLDTLFCLTLFFA